MKNYLWFMVAGYATSLFFEIVANTIGDGKLFQVEGAVVFFIIWYGLLQTVSYVTLRDRRWWVAAIAWAVVGTLAEIFIFHRSNLIVDPIIYALMGLIPLAIYWRREGKLSV